ncbi:PPOX class F420-dependent oxidoreductase [Amycolatopsis palatopharyngis]|uniref:PPOX class F420-dependent oxidoreductase n=1 Tax=Amycolatopsis palatopharyngis TaxID=187982 RepID=UPI000E2404E5|nr:PPOX class F420-dependent oxidoreductase [Amycolatopsis palatopharyngis]
MYEMSRDEWWAFTTEGTRTGKLAVTGADGAPHVTPIWFVLHEGTHGAELIFNTGATSLKGRALRRDPRFSLAVDDQAPPYSFVQFRGSVSLSEDPAELLRWATMIGSRYMGEDRAEEFGRRNAVPGEYLVRAKITKVIAYADMAG